MYDDDDVVDEMFDDFLDDEDIEGNIIQMEVESDLLIEEIHRLENLLRSKRDE